MKSRIVYHYCSSETFFSILSEGTLHMSNIRKSNDYTEVINCLGEFCVALRTACERFFKMYPNDMAFHVFYGETDFDGLIEEAIGNESFTYYAACFSEGRDTLSQWRSYADDASGVSIGFDSDYLLNATTLNESKMRYDMVNYNLLSVKEDIVFYILKKLVNVKQRKGAQISVTDYANAISMAISSFVYDAVFYKNKAFAEEKEWRLVFYPFGNIYNLFLPHKAKDMSANQLYYDRMFEYMQGASNQFGDFRLSSLFFKQSNNSIKSYCKFEFSSIAKLFVREIVLGPKNRMDDLDLRLFLLSLGLDLNEIKIKRSEATYQ